MEEDAVLSAALKLSGKPVDVTLSSRTISWVASASSSVGEAAGARSGESRGCSTLTQCLRQRAGLMLPYIYRHSDETLNNGEESEVHHYHFVRLSEVIRATIDNYNRRDSSSPTPHRLENTDDLSFTVHCVRRKSQGKWRVQELKFECPDQDTRQNWVAQIQQKAVMQGNVRPKNLLVFINPYGGKKEAAKIYNSYAAPLFKLAEIKTTLIYTEARNHARDAVLTKDLTGFDGIVCVGGDGTFAEVVNGLLVRTQEENGINHNDPTSSPQCPTIRIGIIPAGSTDVIVYDTTGVNDPVTSALQILLGCSLGLDICSIHSGHRLLRYTVSFMGYGFFGDVLRDSEKHRWMGPKRYDFSGFRKFFGNRSYACEVSFLTSGDEDHHPQDQTRCRVGCAVCLRRSESQSSDFQDSLSSSAVRLESQQDLRPPVNAISGTWKNVAGDFCAVNAALVSGSNRLSPTGIAPSSHLGNGCLDLVLVHKCSRVNFLKHLSRLGSSGNHFNFDFVEVHRVKEFSFTTLPHREGNSAGKQSRESTSNTSLVIQPHTRYQTTRGNTNTSTWNMDGEIGEILDINVHVHCQLIKLFAYGCEDVQSFNRSCCASGHKTKAKSAWR